MKTKQLFAAATAICMTISVCAQIPAIAAGDSTYTFSGQNVITDGSPNDITDVKLTDNITVTTSGDMNRKYAAITDVVHNRDAGTFPVYDTFKADGSYIYLACANVNDNAIITLNMPNIPAHSKVTLTLAKPTVTNNGSTIRNAHDPYAYLKIADRYLSINGTEFDKWYTAAITTGEDTDKIEFHCDKWGAVAISKIEISSGDTTALHSITVNSTQYANLKINGIKFFADANGQQTITSLPEGEKVTIIAAKNGYAESETEFTVGNSDAVIELPLECQTDAVYYESDFGNNSGTLELNGVFSVGTIAAKDVTSIASRVSFKENGTLKLTNNLVLSYKDGIYANDKYITSKDNMAFEAVFDKENGKTIFIENSKPVYLDAAPVDSISGISGNAAAVEYLSIAYPDKNSLSLNGPDKIAALPNGTAYGEFAAVPAYLIPDIKPSYTVSDNNKATIDENGILTVSGGCGAGTLTVTAEYAGAKTEKTVELVPNAKIASYELNAPGFANLHTASKLSVINITDEFGNKLDMPVTFANGSYFTPDGTKPELNIFTGTDNTYIIEADSSQKYISGETVDGAAYVKSYISAAANTEISDYTINYSDGTSEPIQPTDIPAAKAASDGTVIVNSYNSLGKLISAVKYDVKAGDLTEVSDAGKKVFLAADGEIGEITNSDTTTIGFKIEHAAGLQYEINPTYKISNIGDAAEEKILKQNYEIANGFYDITFKKAEPRRGDIFVNGTMVGNNVDQADADRVVEDGCLYTAEDVYIKDGRLAISMSDGSTKLDYITYTKKPSFYKRPQRVYIIGDSLACSYYGSIKQEVGGGRAGWGQQLPDFLNIPVTNLANSGQYAEGLYNSAFPGIIANAQPGDICLIECAYNDRSYSTRDIMQDTIKKMIAECREKEIMPILVTPNASAHDYKPSVVWSSYLRDVAVDTECQLIDLSQKSYDILYKLYGDDKDGNITKNFNLTEVGGDTLHSSYAGAYVWASVVAQGLKDLGYDDIVNTDFKYSFTDTLGQTITAEIK